MDWCRKEGCYVSQHVDPSTLARLYAPEATSRRYDERVERRRDMNAPAKIWKLPRSASAETEESDDQQNDNVEYMLK